MQTVYILIRPGFTLSVTLCPGLHCLHIKIKKEAKIRNRYNQVPYLTPETVWISDKTRGNITYMRTKRSDLGLHCQLRSDLGLHCLHENKEGGKDLESIQSSTTPDPRDHMQKWQNARNITHKRTKRSAFSQLVTTRLQGTDKTV